MKDLEIKKALNKAVLDMFQDCPGAFLSGSRAFGWDTQESDFDVCIRIEDKDKVFTRVKAYACTYEQSQYYDSAKAGGILLEVEVGGKIYKPLVTINPIPLHPLDMLCWWLATREIRHVSKIDASRLGNRNYKHGAFELLRGFYKSMIEYKGPEWAEQELMRDQEHARAKDPA